MKLSEFVVKVHNSLHNGGSLPVVKGWNRANIRTRVPGVHGVLFTKKGERGQVVASIKCLTQNVKKDTGKWWQKAAREGKKVTQVWYNLGKGPVWGIVVDGEWLKGGVKAPSGSAVPSKKGGRVIWVANRKTGFNMDKPGRKFLIDRTSPLGNPYKIGPDGTREEVIEKYRRYVNTNLSPRALRTLQKIREALKEEDVVLVCWCAPKPCHGDIIKDILQRRTMMKKIAVVGGRNFHDYNLLKRVLTDRLPFHLVSGGARGADSLAEKFAEEFGLSKTIFLPEWGKYGRSAGFRRNHLIIQEADEVIAFWDGYSKGTAHSIKLAERMGKPIVVIRFVR